MVIERDLVCIQCGYNLRGLAPQQNCPECGGAIERSIAFWREPILTARAARHFVAGVTLLELAAIVSFGSILLPPGSWFDWLKSMPVWRQVVGLAVLLFPPVAGWWGAWVLTRRSIVPRGLSPIWAPWRWLIRVSATLAVFFFPLRLVAHWLVGYQPRLAPATLPVLSRLIALATVLMYLYLATVVGRLNRPGLSWVCRILGIVLAGSMLWALRSPRVGALLTTMPVPFVPTAVVGSGYPIALRWPLMWLRDGSSWVPKWSPPVLAVCAAAIAAVIVLEALRRAFGRVVTLADAYGSTAADAAAIDGARDDDVTSDGGTVAGRTRPDAMRPSDPTSSERALTP